MSTGDIVTGIVVAVVILGLAAWGGMKIGSLVKSFATEMKLSDSVTTTMSRLSQWVIWLIGAAYFFRALPIDTWELGNFISEGVGAVLLAGIVVLLAAFIKSK